MKKGDFIDNLKAQYPCGLDNVSRKEGLKVVTFMMKDFEILS